MNIKDSISKSLGNMGLKIQAHSPELLVVAGVVTLVGGVVLACKASRKVDKVLDEHKESAAKIEEQKEMEEAAIEQDIADEETKKEDVIKLNKSISKDLMHNYIRTGLKFVKLYAPAVAVLGLSITCFLTSSRILHNRNVALSSAFAAVSQEFSEYRGRVAGRIGEEMEKELYYNQESQTIEEHAVNEDGSETVETKTERTALSTTPGGLYSRYFTKQTSNMVKKSHSFNGEFLEMQQSYLNDLLKSKGHICLNDAYDAIGIEPIGYGQVVGWIYDPNNKIRKRKAGDTLDDYDVVDLRIQEVLEPIDPMNPEAPRKKCWMIDPNVEGNILDYM